MIIYANGRYIVREHPTMGYAVFAKVPVGIITGGNYFWQQVSKWYLYKKYAIDICNEKAEKAH